MRSTPPHQRNEEPIPHRALLVQPFTELVEFVTFSFRSDSHMCSPNQCHRRRVVVARAVDAPRHVTRRRRAVPVEEHDGDAASRERLCPDLLADGLCRDAVAGKAEAWAIIASISVFV